jgi:hypothetical protein
VHEEISPGDDGCGLCIDPFGHWVLLFDFCPGVPATRIPETKTPPTGRMMLVRTPGHLLLAALPFWERPALDANSLILADLVLAKQEACQFGGSTIFSLKSMPSGFPHACTRGDSSVK